MTFHASDSMDERGFQHYNFTLLSYFKRYKTIQMISPTYILTMSTRIKNQEGDRLSKGGLVHWTKAFGKLLEKSLGSPHKIFS
jgi:hypothetical protein